MSLEDKREADQSNRLCNIMAVGVVVLAAILRFYGLRWGLPDTLHSYSYHPDEFLTVGVALSIGASLIPSFYNYPSLYIYLSAFAITAAFAYGVPASIAIPYLSARVITVLMGVGAVGLTYWSGRKLFSVGAGLTAALILCIAPLHVQHSHFATVDVPSTLFVAAALGFAGMILKQGNWRAYIYGGMMAGLAAGTKYNAGLIVFSIIAAHFLRDGLKWQSLRDKKLWVSIGCTIAAFIISTPGVILAFPSFLSGITYELRHAGVGHGLVFAGTGNGFVYTFTNSLWYGLGPGLTLLFGLAVVWSAFTRSKSAWVILAFILPYYALISLSEVRFARYTLPLFPAIALLCGWFVQEWWLKLTERRLFLLRRILLVSGIAIFIGAFVYTLFLNALFGTPDPRDQAARWIFSHVQKGSRIGVLDYPWFYSPPLSKTFGFGTLPQRQEALSTAPYDITVFADCEEPGCWNSKDAKPDWVILSDYETDDALRLRKNKTISTEDKKQVKRILDDLRKVRINYSRKVQFGGFDIPWLSQLPHDMRYVSPTITIYELQR